MLKTIILSGPPASGKSVLAKKMADKFNLPILEQDKFKELMFDHLGWEERPKIDAASRDIRFYVWERFLQGGYNVILVSHFYTAEKTKLLQISEKYNADVLEYHCMAEGDVLYERLKERWEQGKRHPGHTDYVNFEPAKKGFNHLYDALGLENTIEVDTTDFAKVDYDDLLQKAEEFLAK